MTPPAVRSCLVLGADVGAGQTLVAGALVAGLCGLGVKAVAMQPMARGVQGRGGHWHSSDLQRLAAVGAFALPERVLCTSMHDAADPAPARLPSLDSVVDTFHVLATWADAVVVDGTDSGERGETGAGPAFDTLGLARTLRLPVVLVVALRPGCMAEARAKRQALRRSGLECAGWVANRRDAAADEARAWVAALCRELPGLWLGSIPRLEAGEPAGAARAIDMQRALSALAG